MDMIDASQEEYGMAAAILSAMIEKEQSTFRCVDYLSCSNSHVTKEDREKLVDWAYAVADHCHFQKETVAIAFGLFDRFLSIPSPYATIALQNQSELQLIAVTTLYIAIKMNERVAVHSELFSEVSEGCYTIRDIEETEMIILRGLSWRLNGPTSFQMAMHLLCLIESPGLDRDTMLSVIDEVRFQTERLVKNYEISIQRPSSVAVYVLLRIFQELRQDSLFERLRSESCVELVSALARVVRLFDLDTSCAFVIEGCLGVVGKRRISRCVSQVSLDG